MYFLHPRLGDRATRTPTPRSRSKHPSSDCETGHAFIFFSSLRSNKRHIIDRCTRWSHKHPSSDRPRFAAQRRPWFVAAQRRRRFAAAQRPQRPKRTVNERYTATPSSDFTLAGHKRSGAAFLLRESPSHILSYIKSYGTDSKRGQISEILCSMDSELYFGPSHTDQRRKIGRIFEKFLCLA